jgi:hypothetical protein
VAILRVKNEGMERERVVMDAQMAKLMEQISNLSVELSDALKSNAGYEERLRRVPSRYVRPSHSFLCLLWMWAGIWSRRLTPLPPC